MKFDDRFYKQRDLLNHMKDKQMLIDYTVFNIDYILQVLIKMYHEYNTNAVDCSNRIGGKFFSALNDFSPVLPDIFIEEYKDTMEYLKEADQILYGDIIIPVSHDSIENRYMVRYILFILNIIESNSELLLEYIRFMMYSKNANRTFLATINLYYCIDRAICSNTTISGKSTKLYNINCEGCPLSIIRTNNRVREIISCFSLVSYDVHINNLFKSFFNSYVNELMFTLDNNKGIINDTLKSLNLHRNSLRFKPNDYIGRCINKRKGKLYELRDRLIKASLFNILSSNTLPSFYAEINNINNYLIRVERKNGH